MKDKKKSTRAKKPVRISSEARYRSIVDAAAPIFAKKGFTGTTTKEIANASGVSEALLYKHFPSKEALFVAMQDSSCSVKQSITQAFMNLPSNSDTLIISIYFFFQYMLIETEQTVNENDITRRLMLQSLLADGEFAKTFLENRFYLVVEKFIECLEEAKKVGDLVEDAIPPRLGIWLGHHIVTAMGFMNMSGNDLIDYGCSKQECMIPIIRFTLRGLGFKDKVIREKVNPEVLSEQLKKYQNP